MTTKYLAIVFGYWGRGNTEEEALLHLRKAGAKKFDYTVVYKIEYEEGQEAPYVDDCGTIYYHGDKTMIAEYTRGRRKEVAHP